MINNRLSAVTTSRGRASKAQTCACSLSSHPESQPTRCHRKYSATLLWSTLLEKDGHRCQMSAWTFPDLRSGREKKRGQGGLAWYGPVTGPRVGQDRMQPSNREKSYTPGWLKALDAFTNKHETGGTETNQPPRGERGSFFRIPDIITEALALEQAGPHQL